MRVIIRRLCGLFGLALIALGVALPWAAFVDIAQAPGSDGFLTIQFHFVLTGAASIFVSQMTRMSVATSLFLQALGFINLVIALIAADSGDPAQAWISIFAAATMLQFLSVVFSSDETPEEETPPPENQSRDPVDYVPPKFGAIQEEGFFADALGGAFAYFLSIVAPIFILAILGAYYFLLEAVLIDQVDIHFVEILNRIDDQLREQKLQILIAAASAIAIAVVIALVMRSFAGGDLRGNDFANRDFSAEEKRFLVRATEEVVDYIETMPARRFWFVLQLAPIALMLAAISFPVAVIELQDSAQGLLAPMRAGGDQVLAFGQPPEVAASLLFYMFAAFFGIALAWSFYQAVGRFVPALGRNFYAFLPVRRDPRSLAFDVARAIRLGAIAPERNFSPRDFLYGAFRHREGYAYKSAAFFGALSLIAFILDAGRFYVVTDKGVKHSTAFEFGVSETPFSEIDDLRLSCFAFGEREGGGADIRLSYTLIKNDVFVANLIQQHAIDETLLAALEKVDAEIVAGRAAIHPANNEGRLFKKDDEPAVYSCAAELREIYEPQIAERLIRLLRLEE